MKKSYFLFLFFVLMILTSQKGISQNTVNINSTQETIEDLAIYPNPVTNGNVVVYISSNRNLSKKIELFNVLGKQIYTTVLTGKELNISNFGKGVYILKITENNISETRKLVIN